MTASSAPGRQILVDLLSMNRATNLLHQAGDELAGDHRRVLDSRDSYRHQVSPELARALESFAGRWTLALEGLAQICSGTGDALAATQRDFHAIEDSALGVLARHGDGL